MTIRNKFCPLTLSTFNISFHWLANCAAITFETFVNWWMFMILAIKVLHAYTIAEIWKLFAQTPLNFIESHDIDFIVWFILWTGVGSVEGYGFSHISLWENRFVIEIHIFILLIINYGINSLIRNTCFSAIFIVFALDRAVFLKLPPFCYFFLIFSYAICLGIKRALIHFPLPILLF